MKKNKPQFDYPYKFIRVIGRRHGFNRLSDIKELRPFVYSVLDHKKNIRLVIDTQSKSCYRWYPENQKLVLLKPIKKERKKMICRYCNYTLTKTGENYYCSYCKIPFKKEEGIENRTDLLHIPELTNDPKFFAYTSVQEMINCLEVELLNYLGLARKFERELKQKIYRAGRDNADEIDKKDLKDVRTTLRRIENIYIERTGYYPPAVYPARVQMEIDKIKKLNKKLNND